MGMFSWFRQKQKMDDEMLPPPARPAPPVESPKKNIGEPVLSLLDSMKDVDIWEIINTDSGVYGGYSGKLQHKKHGEIYLHFSFGNRELEDLGVAEYAAYLRKYGTFADYKISSRPSSYYVYADWMTADERNAVDSQLNVLVDRIHQKASDERNAAERNKFMVLVKGGVNEEG